MNVPLVDLKAQYKTIKKEIDSTIMDTVENTAFIMGDRVKNFEKNFADFCNTKYCVGVSSGTSALHLALLALGLKPDDEVITVPNTFIATIQHIAHLDGKIKFVDIDPETYLMDVNKLEEVITEKTKIILPVHLYGQMCDMEAIKKIADKYNLKILEDAAQAHGAEFDGKKPGYYGDIAIYSFYPGKNLGAYGDAGALTTNNEEYAKKAAQLRNHGRLPGEKYFHAVPGFNERIDALQAAILDTKLPHLDNWTGQRRKNAELYNSLLESTPLITPGEPDSAKHVYHLYVTRAESREKLQEFLKQNEISTGVHYPVPLHLQPAYEFLGLKERSFPVAEQASREILSLPMFPELTEAQINFVVDKIKEFYQNE